MNEMPHVRLFLTHPTEFGLLDGEDLTAVEKLLRQKTYEIVGPTLVSGWAANDVPLLRVPGTPVTFAELVPGKPEWTPTNRIEYLRQQAKLIDRTYEIAPETIYRCDMCTPKQHCDSTCKDLLTAAGQPVTVSADYQGTTYTATLVITLEWMSDAYDEPMGSMQAD